MATPASPTPPATSGPAPLSAAERKRLQQLFGFGQQKQKLGDYEYAHSMYAQCVVGDPSNLVYVEAMLANLQARYQKDRRKARIVSSRAEFKKARSEYRWMDLFRLGVDLLEENPWDIPTLRTLAEACAALHFNEVELRYLKNALDSNPKDVEVNRHCAQSLARMGQVDQAIACWHRVEELRPGNAEASRMISQLTVEKNRAVAGFASEATNIDKPQVQGGGLTSGPKGAGPTQHAPRTALTREGLEKAIAEEPANTKNYLQLSRLYEEKGELKEAEQVLRRALQVSGNDVTIRENLEDVQIRLAQRQIAVAEQRHRETPAEGSEQLVRQLRKDLNRLELVIFQNRAQRYPGRLDIVYELAVRLMRAGLFEEAARQFQVAAQEASRQAACWLHQGECLQQLRQYAEALKSYVRSLEAASHGGQTETLKTALYRAAVLAEALKKVDQARTWLEELLRLDPAFRDARARLDKLASIPDTNSQMANEP